VALNLAYAPLCPSGNLRGRRSPGVMADCAIFQSSKDPPSSVDLVSLDGFTDEPRVYGFVFINFHNSSHTVLNSHFEFPLT
jgi:hypothetical protein